MKDSSCSGLTPRCIGLEARPTAPATGRWRIVGLSAFPPIITHPFLPLVVWTVHLYCPLHELYLEASYSLYCRSLSQLSGKRSLDSEPSGMTGVSAASLHSSDTGHFPDLLDIPNRDRQVSPTALPLPPEPRPPSPPQVRHHSISWRQFMVILQPDFSLL